MDVAVGNFSNPDKFRPLPILGDRDKFRPLPILGDRDKYRPLPIVGHRVKFSKLHTSPNIARKMFESCYRLVRNVPFKKVSLIWELIVVIENVKETSLRSELMSPDSSSLSFPSVRKPEKYAVECAVDYAISLSWGL